MNDYDGVDPELKDAVDVLIETEGLRGWNFVFVKDCRDVPPEAGILLVEIQDGLRRYGWLWIAIERSPTGPGPVLRRGQVALQVMTRERVEGVLAAFGDATTMEIYARYATKVYGKTRSF